MIKDIPKRIINKWLGFAIALLIVITTIWVSNNLVHQLKKEEQHKVENIVKALELLGSETPDEPLQNETRELAQKITVENTTIPLILVDENNQFFYQKNLDSEQEKLESDSIYLKNKIQSMGENHSPISVNLPFGDQKIFYENSDLLIKLQYYPIILLLIILLFGWFTFWYFRTVDNTTRSFLWAGMAKETAHQIGTPLSSLLGWLELLKMENVDTNTISEMETDVQRLNQIAERFSKIGSKPQLESYDLVQTVQNTFDYLSKRLSSHIQFEFNPKQDTIMVKHNPELMSWVLENLIKNAVDAMQNKGEIILSVFEQKGKVWMSVKDNGPGIPNNLKSRIFEPGYTTKKRGWGLGLSLAKRIVKDYHKGKIYVAVSEKNVGTEFKIVLRK